MRFVLLEDETLITATITHPKIYKYVCDASSPDPIDFVPRFADNIFYVGVVDDEDNYCGLFMLELINPYNIVLHTCLLPECWGQKAYIISKQIQEYIFSEIPDLCNITTMVPASNRLALRFAKRAGLQEYGMLPNGWNGIDGVDDLIYLYVGRS